MNDDRSNIPELKTVFVESIYDYVAQDDIEYATKIKEEIQGIYGLCYVNKANEIELLVLKDKGVTTAGTLYHETIHGADYYMLSKYTGNKDIRKLQENFPFHLWSEFHAEYLTYVHLIKINGLSDTPQKVADGFRGKIQNAYSGLKVSLGDLLDVSVRQYGRYIALQECYPELPIHRRNFYPNDSFMDIYIFLRKHRTFESIITSMDEWEKMLRNTEEQSK